MFNGLKQFNGFVQLKTVFFMIFIVILTVIINEEREEETKMNKLVFANLSKICTDLSLSFVFNIIITNIDNSLLPVVRPIYGIILPKKWVVTINNKPMVRVQGEKN